MASSTGRGESSQRGQLMALWVVSNGAVCSQPHCPFPICFWGCLVCTYVARRTDGRIPLKDLIRFKERQWFVEELEVSPAAAALWFDSCVWMSSWPLQPDQLITPDAHACVTTRPSLGGATAMWGRDSDSSF